MIPTHRYASILRCSTWGEWPENSDFRSTPVEYSVDGSETIGFVINIVSYEKRVRPENSPAGECEKSKKPILWRGAMEVGYKLGNYILKAPDDVLKLEIKHSPPLKGEIDIQFLIGSTKEYPNSEVAALIEPIAYSCVSYLNILLGEYLVPIGPIQTRKLIDGNSEFTNNLVIACRERPTVNKDNVTNLLERFIDIRTKCSRERERILDVSMKRFLNAQIESDVIDKYCDLWEVCEFLCKGRKVKGTIVAAIAQILTDHINQERKKVKKAKVENNLNIKGIYEVRCDIVHNAVENTKLVEEKLQTLNEIATELIKYELGAPYEGNKHLEKYIA